MAGTAPHKILNIEIVNDLTGETMADIDAIDGADAMAYFLTSRRVDPEATADRIRMDVWMRDSKNGEQIAPTTPIVSESRNPITGAVEWAYFTRVH
jgi:hypothetical protein